MTFKIFNFRSIVTYLTIVSFYIASTVSAVAAPMPPISLAQMYSLAAQGNVRALRAAVQRGLNIDATDRYGNTGLCHSIYQHNYTAYNAFHASGANTRHPCIQNIPTEQYDYFMNSSRVQPITATPRDAYKEFADGEFIFSTTTWIVGGLLLAGGITALVLSSGGKKKKKAYYFPPNNDNTFKPTDDSLAAFAGTLTPSDPVSNSYVPVKITNGLNTTDFILNNDSQITLDDGSKKSLADTINFNDSVLEYSKYLQVGMKAIDGNQVVNGQIPLTGTEVGTTITLLNNTVGMAALHNANAINNNTLKIIARNGTLGMVGSDRSLIRNNGNIDIAFQGTSPTDQVNGMYVDTSSTAINDGKITGNVAVDSATGTLIGMQGRLINQVANPAGSIPIQLTNNGKIELSATAAAGKTISNSLIGMGSFLEKAFLEGTKLLRRTGFIDIANYGDIDLNVNLGDTGTYDSTQSNLYDGTGGIIGIRADAHTTASNNGNINLTIAPESAAGIENSHAGMLSVHGGTISNNKNITISGGIGGYGMLGVRGEGTNSEFNTLNPTIVNSASGTITVNSVDGFGMATRHGGTVVNNGTIIMGDKGTGLQINAGSGSNTGTITLNNGGIGMAIKKNTTSSDGTIYNASTAKLQNENIITINNANGSSGMYIEDGLANNLGGVINVNGINTTTESSYGIRALNGKVLNSGEINMNVLLSGDLDSYGIYGDNATTVNNSGTITSVRKGTGIYTTSGSSTNSGKITMNGRGSTGMASESGAITNTDKGEITVISGTGIKSTSGQVINEGKVIITDGSASTGISSGSSVINSGSISITGADSTGIAVEENGTASNSGIITLTSNRNSTENFGMVSAGGDRAQIENSGIITLNGYNYASSKEKGYGMSIGDGQAINNNMITINQMYGYGMASTTGTLTNNGDITLTNGGYGIKGESGESFNSEGGTIIITGTPVLESSYGMAMEDGTAKNFGKIDVTGSTTNDATYGIYVNGGNGINHNQIDMRSDNAYGIFDAASGDGAITNFAGAVINLHGNNSTGMQSSGNKAENYGTINIGVNNGGTVTGGVNGIGMTANDGTTALNSGQINMNGANAVGMFADGGTVINSADGVITMNGNGGTIFKTSNDGTAINLGDIVINAQDYNLFTTTDTDEGNFVNNGNVTVGASGSQVIRVGDNSSVTNNKNIDLNGSNGFIIYTSGSGNATNNGTLNIGAGSDNSHGIYMSETANGTVINSSTGIINVNGSNSNGMTLASNDTSASITNKGKINVSGNGSKAIAASNGGTINNEGTITMNGGSAAIEATGAVVNNKAGATITTAANSDADGIKVIMGATPDAEAATVTNDGTIIINGNGDAINAKGSSTAAGMMHSITNNSVITINGSGSGIFADAANINNTSSARINISGSGYGIRQTSGTIDNSGTITVTGNNGTGISSGGTATNNGTITAGGTNAKGMELTTGGTGTNNSTIIASGTDAVGIYVNGGTAENTGNISASGTGATGVYATGGTAYNQTSISVNGDNAIGMAAGNGTVTNGKTIVTIETDERGDPVLDADGNVVTNTEHKPGVIDVTGNNAAGMKLTGTGKVLNNTGALISVSGDGATGIWAAGSGVAENEGTITVSNATNGSSGMKATSGTATNKGTISVSADGAWGMDAAGGTVVNDTTGIIDLTTANSVGIYVHSGNGENRGVINFTGENTIGLLAAGGTATNAADITINGTGVVGLYAHGGTVVNASGKTITFSNGEAAIKVDSGSGRNAGTINVDGGNLNAILVSGGNASNDGTIELTSSASGSIGMKATAGTATNNGTITIASNAAGMDASGSGQVANNKTITVSGANAVGMSASGGTATNNSNGTITVTGANAKGMAASSGTVLNNGTINATAANTIAMYANGGTATNGSSGKINTSASSAYVMLAEGTGTVNNQGTISYSGSGAALQANGATANNSGIITATNGTGMAAYGTASSGGKAVNSGTINASGTNGKGMAAISSTVETKVTNAANGTINVSGSNGIGMLADGSKAQAVNLGTINVTTTSASAIGMKAVNGGSVENGGTINMASGSTGTGIYVGNGSKLYNNASGKIVFAGGNTHTGTISGNPSAGAVNICEDGTNTCTNKRFIYMEAGSQLINSGTMATAASFRMDDMGAGRLMLGSTGRMEAGEEISGTLYAMGDEAMVAQGQKDVYVNEKALTASNVDVNLQSASPMWNVSLANSRSSGNENASAGDAETVGKADENEPAETESKDVIYRRVSFYNLVDNASQAAYLEQNYALRNNIYNPLMTATSTEAFDQAVYSGLGLDLIPNFAKQNMDVMRNTNRQINNAVFNNTDTQAFRTTAGYDYFDREQDGDNGLSGYKDEAHTAYAVFDKQVSPALRYGIGASVTKYESDYDNGSEREEIMAQIMTPVMIGSENTKLLSMPKIGMGWGEYKRFDQGMEYKANTRNYYYGISNEARHDIDMDVVTLEPVAEFNILGMYQNRTKENIRVEANNNLSVEGGLGLYAKKQFTPFGDDELNIRLGGTYYHEFANPYQAADAGVVGLLGHYHMNGYETQRDRAVLATRFDYKRGRFNFYLEGSRFIEDDSTYSINAGLTYAF